MPASVNISAMPNAAASKLVLAPYSEKAVIEAARGVLAELGHQPSVGFLFVSADYRPNLPDFLELVQLHAHLPVMVGCSASGLVGNGSEAEGAQGFSLMLMHLPDTKVHVAELPVSEDDTMEDAAEYWHKATGVQTSAVDAWTVLADPMNMYMEEWLAEWNRAYPGIPTVGGAASGGPGGDDIFLFHDRHMVEGAVAVGFQGGFRMHTLVSQGCRAIGEPFTITGAERNFVTSLGSRPAYEILQETFEALPDADKTLAQGNLFAGLAMSEYVEDFKTGDFLIRNLLGADPQHGVLALGAYPRVGQTLQFQLRDARSADAELRHLAGDMARDGVVPFASLLFPCNGRGRNFFGTANHDAGLLRSALGPHASAGFFCNGEIGPVGGKNFIHGYTASAALFSNL